MRKRGQCPCWAEEALWAFEVLRGGRERVVVGGGVIAQKKRGALGSPFLVPKCPSREVLSGTPYLELPLLDS